MATTKVLKAIVKQTKATIKNFIPVTGQTPMKTVAVVGASQAGIRPEDVHNGRYNNEHAAAYFTVVTPTMLERHYWVKQSALLLYIIERSNPGDPLSTTNFETVYTKQMPQIVTKKTSDTEWGSGEGGDAGSSSSKTSKN